MAARISIRIAKPMRDLTQGEATVVVELEAPKASVEQLLVALESHYPGLRQRILEDDRQIRGGVKLFVKGAPIPDISRSVLAGETLHVVCELS